MLLPLSDIWKIDGKAIPTPQIFAAEMVSEERTADGVAHRDRMREGVRLILMDLNILSNGNWLTS